MEGKLTIAEVLQVCFNMLGEISIPEKYWEQIAKPIGMVKHNIASCLNAISEQEAQAEPEIIIEEDEEEPEPDAPEEE